jgi:hypothetical protein
MSRTILFLALALALASLAAACTTVEPLDAQGTWDLQLTTAPTGTCFDPNKVVAASMTVRLDDAGTYLFTPADPEPGDTATGTYRCTESECEFDITMMELSKTQGGATITLTTVLDLRINEELAISGTGNVTASGGLTCAHVLTVGGTVQ